MTRFHLLLIAVMGSCQMPPQEKSLSFTAYEDGAGGLHCQLHNPTKSLWILESRESAPAPFTEWWNGREWEGSDFGWCRYGVGIARLPPGEHFSFSVKSDHPGTRVSLFVCQVEPGAEFQEIYAHRLVKYGDQFAMPPAQSAPVSPQVGIRKIQNSD